MENIIREGQRVAGTKAHFFNKDYSGVEFSKKNFSALTGIAGDAVYIDGGNATLLVSGSLSVHYIRIASVLFEQGKRSKMTRRECYVVVRAAKKNHTIEYYAETYPVTGTWQKSWSFTAQDKNGRRPIEAVAEIIRRISELDEAIKAEAQLIVLDGTLEYRTAEEQQKIEALANKNIVAVAKTSTLLTDEGTLYSALLAHHAPNGTWQYYPVAKAPIHIRFCKFHELSTHIFRVDSFHDNELSTIVENSRDVLFPGYPYGLIMADRVARVSERETEMLRARLFARAGPAIEQALRGSDAHTILDSTNLM